MSRTCRVVVASLSLQPQLCNDLICKANELKSQTPGNAAAKRDGFIIIFMEYKNSKQNSAGIKYLQPTRMLEKHPYWLVDASRHLDPKRFNRLAAMFLMTQQGANSTQLILGIYSRVKCWVKLGVRYSGYFLGFWKPVPCSWISLVSSSSYRCSGLNTEIDFDFSVWFQKQPLL